jgi:hypothetical protein
MMGMVIRFLGEKVIRVALWINQSLEKGMVDIANIGVS